eukprot:7377313-Prymnesium_polylepis.1
MRSQAQSLSFRNSSQSKRHNGRMGTVTYVTSTWSARLARAVAARTRPNPPIPTIDSHRGGARRSEAAAAPSSTRAGVRWPHCAATAARTR